MVKIYKGVIFAALFSCVAAVLLTIALTVFNPDNVKAFSAMPMLVTSLVVGQQFYKGNIKGHWSLAALVFACAAYSLLFLYDAVAPLDAVTFGTLLLAVLVTLSLALVPFFSLLLRNTHRDYFARYFST